MLEYLKIPFEFMTTNFFCVCMIVAFAVHAVIDIFKWWMCHD